MSNPNEPKTHVYDDIVEMDNPLPRWWLVTFFGTVIFGLGYFYYYETFKIGLSPADELAADQAADIARKVAEAKKHPPMSPEQLLALSNDAAAIADGGATFRQVCSPCHGDSGEGKIGPNLTDKYWIHGGQPENVLKTITSGVPDKGMPAWESTIGPRKTQLVAAYVLSIRGKNLPGKEPQGTEEAPKP